MQSTKPAITVELYAMPRLKAGRSSVTLYAATVGELLTALDEVCPQLHALVEPICRVNPQYLLSINGRRFTAELHAELQAGDQVLLLSADAGG